MTNIIVGITTLEGYSNYGNRLQAYALHASISSLTSSRVLEIQSRPKNKNTIKSTVVSILDRAGIRKDLRLRMVRAKKNKILPFSNKYINATSNHHGMDIYVTGSDQVWNPFFAGTPDMFLQFAPKEKRIAYAASFGVSSIPEDKRDVYARHLSEMKYISVREEDGAKIVKELTGRDVPVALDPTMLLTAEDWDHLLGQEPFERPKKKYIVIYSLRGLGDNQRKAEEYAAQKGYEVYHVMGDLYNSEHKVPTPIEFLHRIKNAEAVITDSFHACVFSIIFHTPFVATKRQDSDMSSRLKTLLSLAKLEGCLVESSADFGNALGKINFGFADKNIAHKREESLVYLQKSLRLDIDN